MKEITGQLKMLGSGSIIKNNIGKSFIKYNSIEIGEEILQNIRTAQSLGDFVERGLGEDVTLFLNGKLLIGVKLSNGKVYYWKRSIGIVIFIIVAGPLFGSLLAGGSSHWLLSIFIVIGLYSLFFKKELMQIFFYQPKLSSLGGTALKS